MRNVRPSSTTAVNAARLLVGVLAVVGVLLPGAAADAKASPTPVAGHSPQPSLTIAVSDNVTVANPGDTLVYTVTVGNSGDAASGQVPLK